MGSRRTAAATRVDYGKRWKPVLTTLEKERKPEANRVRLAPKITVAGGGSYCLFAACEEIFVQSKRDESLAPEPLLVAVSVALVCKDASVQREEELEQVDFPPADQGGTEDEAAQADAADLDAHHVQRRRDIESIYQKRLTDEPPLLKAALAAKLIQWPNWLETIKGPNEVTVARKRSRQPLAPVPLPEQQNTHQDAGPSSTGAGTDSQDENTAPGDAGDAAPRPAKKQRTMSEASLKNLDKRKTCGLCGHRHGNRKMGRCDRELDSGEKCSFMFPGYNNEPAPARPLRPRNPGEPLPEKLASGQAIASAQKEFDKAVNKVRPIAEALGCEMILVMVGTIPTKAEGTFEGHAYKEGMFISSKEVPGSSKDRVVVFKASTGGAFGDAMAEEEGARQGVHPAKALTLGLVLEHLRVVKRAQEVSLPA